MSRYGAPLNLADRHVSQLVFISNGRTDEHRIHDSLKYSLAQNSKRLDPPPVLIYTPNEYFAKRREEQQFVVIVIVVKLPQ